MEETQTSRIVPVSIQPRSVFGLQIKTRGNIHFTSKQEVIYPVAGVLAIHDFTVNKQKFLRFPEGCVLEMVRISPNRKLLAVAERIDKKSFANIYELPSHKKRRTLFLPTDNPTTDISNMTFVYDSKGIAILSHEPDSFLTIFFFDKNETFITGRVSNRTQKGIARSLACNPGDTGLVAVGGDYTLKLLSKTDKGFTLIGNVKTENLIITSLVWISSDIIIAGTADTKLLIVEVGEPKAKFSAEEVVSIDLAALNEPNEDPEKAANVDYDVVTTTERLDVVCLTAFPKGFAYAIHNVVYIFEKVSNFKYLKKTILEIPMDIYARELYQISSLAINQQQDTIIVTPKHSQIYIGIVFVPETLKACRMEFKTLGEPLHIDGIVGLSVCSWKPIIMTASKDQTIRIWNYKTGKVELVKKYQVDITVISLHPSGIFVAVGFSDQLRLMEILLDDLKIVKTFNFPKCSNVVFSHQGHMLAASYEYYISIVSVFSFETIRLLKGHNGTILSLTWSNDDEHLVSAGADGAVYEWQALTGVRVNELVQKGIEYRDVVITNDRSAVFAVTDKGILKEISNSDVVRETKLPEHIPLTCIAMARSDLVMFIASQKGHLYNVQVPFLEAGGGQCTNTRFFESAITKMKITYDDSLLATACEDGTLVIWTIMNNEGRIASMDSELGKCTDLMIPRDDLIEKIELIASLELRIEQQKAEFSYARQQGDSFHSEQMRDIHKGYCDAIEELKSKNELMEQEHIDEFNQVTADIEKTHEAHQKALLDMEKEFHEKIIIEYEKSTAIKEKMDNMREDYELKLRKSAGCLQDTIESLESDFKKQLQERQELIRQLKKELDTKKIEFVEYCRQVEADNDRRLVESQLASEKQLKEEQDISLKWRGEAGVLKKKFITTTRDNSHLYEEVNKLKVQHEKYVKKIHGYEKDIIDLKKVIDERDVIIREKDKAALELTKKNQELGKINQVLQFKIDELKAQIEPRDREIREKKDQITDMENELEELQQNNLKLELQFSELKDKFHGTKIELKTERVRCKTARSQVSKICGEIYQVSGHIQHPDKLKNEVKRLFHKYADDERIKNTLLQDADVHLEYLRQREHLENLAADKKTKGSKKKDTGDLAKLIKENVVLIGELNRVRTELKDTEKHAGKMEALLGIARKNIPTTVAREKLEKAIANYDEIDRKHLEEILKLEEIIKTLTADNQSLRNEYAELLKKTNLNQN